MIRDIQQKMSTKWSIQCALMIGFTLALSGCPSEESARVDGDNEPAGMAGATGADNESGRAGEAGEPEIADDDMAVDPVEEDTGRVSLKMMKA